MDHTDEDRFTLWYLPIRNKRIRVISARDMICGERKIYKQLMQKHKMIYLFYSIKCKVTKISNSLLRRKVIQIAYNLKLSEIAGGVIKMIVG